MTDWTALGGNPVPGDPAGIRSMATVFSNHADAISQQIRLVNVAATFDTIQWQGPAATAFRGSVQPLVTALRATVDNHTTAAGALTTFAKQIETLQVTAQQYAAQATADSLAAATAAKQAATYQAQLTQAQSSYDAIPLSPALGVSAPGLASPYSPVLSPAQQQANQLQSTITTSQAGVASAGKAWSAAQTSLGHTRSMADGLNGQARHAAWVCAQALQGATKPVSSPKFNPVVAFLQSDQFNLLAGIVQLPGAELHKLRDELEETGKKLTAAEKAETAFDHDLDVARSEARTGATRGLRKAAKNVLRDQNDIEADLQAATADAGIGNRAAAAALTAFTNVFESDLPSKAWLTGGKVLSYTWTQAGNKASQVLGGDATPAEEEAAESLLSQAGDKVPVVGSVLTAGTSAYDIDQGHYTDAAADVGGFTASVVVGSALVLVASSGPGAPVVVVAVVAGVAVSEGIEHWRGIVHAASDPVNDYLDDFNHDLQQIVP